MSHTTTSSELVFHKQAPLEGLPVELLLGIGAFITDCSATTNLLHGLCLTNRKLNDIFTPTLYHSVKVSMRVKSDQHYQGRSTEAALEEYLDPKTIETIESFRQHREHIKRLHVRVHKNPENEKLEEQEESELSISQKVKSLFLDRLQSATKSGGEARPLKSCRIDMSYDAKNGDEGCPSFGTEDWTFTWLKGRNLRALKAEKYILRTYDTSGLSKDTVIVVPFVNTAVHPGTNEIVKAENEEELEEYLSATRDPIIMGYLPKNAEHLTAWIEEDAESINRHAALAAYTATYWLESVRKHNGLKFLESFEHSVVKPITFIGSVRRYEIGSSQKRVSDHLERSPGPNRLVPDAQLISFEDWSSHPDLAHELGIDSTVALDLRHTVGS